MKKFIVLLSPLFLFSFLFAQDEPDFSLKDSTNLCKHNYMRQYDYENNISPFPPRKKSNWAIGIDLGMPTIHGDIPSKYFGSFGAGLKIRKGITHFFSIRYQGIYMQTTGQDLKLKMIDGQMVYGNYRARMSDNSLQAVFSVGALNPHKRRSKVIFNFFAGAGFTTSFSQADYVNENGNPYDYSGIANMETWGDRFFVARQLNDLHDKNYETVTVPESSDYMFIKDTRILPSLTFGTGIDVYVSKRIDLAFEYRLTANFDDYLDGFKSPTNRNDIYSYASFGLNFKIGKREEPSYWQNPLANDMDDMAEMKRTVSPEYLNNLVDEKLATIDMDKDGVPDYRDAETGTPTGAEVDATGKAMDSDNDGIPNYRDEEPNSPAGAQVDALGRTIKTVSENPDNNQDNINWHVFFNTNSSSLSKDYTPIVLDAAVFLLSYPERTVTVNGYADPRSTDQYNLDLSKKRANKVKDELVDLGVSPDRIKVNYFGESELLTPLKDGDNLKKQLVNRRVSILVD